MCCVCVCVCDLYLQEGQHELRIYKHKLQVFCRVVLFGFLFIALFALQNNPGAVATKQRMWIGWLDTVKVLRHLTQR